MLFNSYEYLVFLPVVFLLYWLVFQKNLKGQNAFILLASYIFYGWWDWRFLGLIAFSSLVDYWCGLRLGATSSRTEEGSAAIPSVDKESIYKTALAADKPEKESSGSGNSLAVTKTPKFYLGLSLAVNLGVLGFFKYFNFFIDSTVQMINTMGFQANPYSLQLILPVGISFYTFQTMSYTIDIYRGKMKPTSDPVAFFAYVSFFPQLVAGPIERAANLLPQFFKKRVFDYSLAMDGMRQILWGLFMKVVIADNCAVFVNQAFNHPENQPASNLLIGAVFFSFQIYGDFGGYSNIAIGTGKLLGFRLMQNFAFPYFSRDIAEFWRRWHISLSTWFRDYVYIPLGGSRTSKLLSIRNIFIIFLVSGFWHGANWTFLVWGGIHSMLFIPLFIFNRTRINLAPIELKSLLPAFKDLFSILLTFSLVTLAWIFFRAENIHAAWIYLSSMFDMSIFSKPVMDIRVYLFMTLSIVFITLEWMGRTEEFAIQKMAFNKSRIIRYGLYYSLVMMVFLFATKDQEFIYFQF